MMSENFREEVRTLRDEDFALECAIHHRHRVLIINAYDVDLYQSWTLESYHFFQKQMNVNAELVEIGYSFLHLQRTFFRQIAVLLKRKFILLRRKQNKYFLVRYDYKPKVYSKIKSISRGLSSTLRILRNNNFTEKSDPNALKDRAIFSTMATTYNTVEFKVRRHPLKLFSLNLAYEFSYSITSGLCQEKHPCQIIVGNGRLVKPAAVVAFSRSENIPVAIIERGSFPGTFDLYKKSPHSILERRTQAKELVAFLGPTETARIATDYISLRKEYDPISGLKWHRNFEKGLLPELDERKLCVCFTSTETEYAVFGDEQNGNEFQNQAEAFEALARRLDPNEWQIVIRRHPYARKNVKHDPEARLWDSLKGLQHVRFVGPNSRIDSYELCRHANLISHFNSSMGPEAISMECAPVITMGPTLWESEDSPYLFNTVEKVLNLNKKVLPVRPLKDIEAWGVYWATFGYRFGIVTWHNSKGFVDGKRIL